MTRPEAANQLLEIIRAAFQYGPDEEPIHDTLLRAILNENSAVFQGMLLLLRHEHTGNACIILARTITEWTVNLEYMKLHGLEAQLDAFWTFRFAEAKQDIDYLRDTGVDISFLDTSKIEEEFETHRDKFIRKRKGQPEEIWRSWSRQDFDTMLTEILKAERVAQDIKVLISKIYAYGSRRTHASPTAIRPYVLPEEIYRDSDKTLRDVAFATGLTALAYIASTFVDRKNAADLEERLQSVLQSLSEDDAI